MIGIVPKKGLTTQGLKFLKSHVSIGLSDIKNAADNEDAILIFEAFSGTWQADRKLLALFCKRYLEDEQAPFFVIEMLDDGAELLKPANFYVQLKTWRQIEIETERNVALETGYIESPSEFISMNENWLDELD